MTNLRSKLMQSLRLEIRQHQIFPTGGRNQTLGQVFETWPRVRPADAPKVLGLDRAVARGRQNAGRENCFRAQPELLGQVVQSTVAICGGITQGSLPQAFLLGWLGLVHVETEKGSVQLNGFTARQHHRSGQPLHQVTRRSRERSRAALNQQRARQQNRFPFPKLRKLVQLRSLRRKVLHSNAEHFAAKILSRDCSGIFLALRIVAAKMYNRGILRIRLKNSNYLGRNCLMLLGNPTGKRDRLDQRLHTPIQSVHARQIMQDALVDAEWRGSKAVSGFHVQQTKTAQRTGRRKSAPMRISEHRHCDTESCARSRWMALGFAALSR